MKRFSNLPAIARVSKGILHTWKKGTNAYPEDVEFIIVNDRYEIWADGTIIDEINSLSHIPEYVYNIKDIICGEPEIVFVSHEPDNIVLSKDGKIRAKDAKMQVIGEYEHRQPRKEENNPYKGCKGYKMVSDLWSGGIPYRGSACEYTRKEFVEAISQMLQRRPIVIGDDGQVIL